jgi:citrate lyase beta subunit
MTRTAARLAIEDTNIHRSLSAETEQNVLSALKTANEMGLTTHPGDRSERQPVHTFYGGAHLFKSDTAHKLGQLALKSMESNAPNCAEFARTIGLPGSKKLPKSVKEIHLLEKKIAKDPAAFRGKNPSAWLAHSVYQRVLKKLSSEPVEDYRIDFEDGFGYRSDIEEDHEAMRTASETALGMERKTLPPFFGIRIKTFSEELKKRAIRTLDIYLTTLCEKTGGILPEHFVINLPKVISPEQVAALVQLLAELEQRLHLPERSLKFEFMVETPQILFGPDGPLKLPAIVAAGDGRCVAAHFGPYDYSAALGIASSCQSLDHPSCDFARHMMQVALAGTGVRVSDGAVHLIPVGPHRAGVKPLTSKQIMENREAVHAAWKKYFDLIRRSLNHGFFQSWDLHPSHLPIRYAAVYSFFLEGLEPAALRLRSFIEKGKQASLSGQMFDDAASGQGLLNYFHRALTCGAIDDNDLKEIGMTSEEIKIYSFSDILNNRG